MKLGIMSDSHGRVPLVRQALSVLKAAGAQAIVHCGDVGGLEVLDEMLGWQCWFVWGNSDRPWPSWEHHVRALGLPWPDGPLSLTIADKKVAVFHGHEHGIEAAAEPGVHDYLLHGHTHQYDDYRRGPLRVINPGALHRVSVPTVALLDLATDKLTLFELSEAGR